MKKIVSLIMACILLLGLCACSSEPSLVGTAPTGDNASTELPDTDAANTEPPATDAPTADSKVFKLGDSVELDDVVVSFLDVTESTGEQFLEPAEGNIFVLCEFEITNNSDKELAVSSMLSFEAYCDDYTCEYSLSALMAKGDKDQLDGSVAAGKKMKGVIGYELPSDWKELEVHYTPDILDNDKIIFVATNG